MSSDGWYLIGSGEDIKAVMESYGLCRTTYYKWEEKREARGVEELVSLRPTGRPGPLTERQESQVFIRINARIHGNTDLSSGFGLATSFRLSSLKSSKSTWG